MTWRAVFIRPYLEQPQVLPHGVRGALEPILVVEAQVDIASKSLTFEGSSPYMGFKR